MKEFARRIQKLEAHAPPPGHSDRFLSLLRRRGAAIAGIARGHTPPAAAASRRELDTRLAGMILEFADSPHNRVRASDIPDPTARALCGMLATFIRHDSPRRAERIECLKGMWPEEYLAAVYGAVDGSSANGAQHAS